MRWGSWPSWTAFLSAVAYPVLVGFVYVIQLAVVVPARFAGTTVAVE